MRRRSNTIQADSFEEFYEISLSQSPDSLVSDPSALYESPYCNSPPDSDSFNSSLSPLKGLSYAKKAYGIPMDCIGEDDDDEDDCYLATTPSTDTGSMSLSARGDSFMSYGENYLSKYCNSGFNNKAKANGEDTTGKLHKVMIVGGMGTGRHTIINTLFKEENTEKKDEPKLRNALDLLIRSRKENNQTQRFKFWIRDPNCQRFDPLIKVYYKSIDYYVFIYKSTEENSLETVERSIQDVLNEVPRSRFRGILIGNGLDKRTDKKVMTEEAEKLKERYGLERFLELEDMEKDTESLDKEFIGFLGCD